MKKPSRETYYSLETFLKVMDELSVLSFEEAQEPVRKIAQEDPRLIQLINDVLKEKARAVRRYPLF